MKIDINIYLKLPLANVAPKVLQDYFMQQKNNAIFTNRDLELNASLRFNDSLSLCNRALVNTLRQCLHPDMTEKLLNVMLCYITKSNDFQDVPYLDLCVYPPDSRRHRAGTLEAAMEFDKLSLCSMDSVCVATSRPLAQVGYFTMLDSPCPFGQ